MGLASPAKGFRKLASPAWHAGGQEFESPWLHPNHSKGFQVFLKPFFSAQIVHLVQDLVQDP